MARSSEARIIKKAAQKAGIDPKILWGLYGAETNFGKNTNVSSAGAQGPFQFMPATARSMGIDPHNFRQAAYAAARYLAQYKDRGTRGMLAAYNAGPAGNPNNPETRAYVPKVLQLAKTYPGGGGARQSATRQSAGTAGTRITEQPTAGSIAAYQPGVDNSALRQQVTANYFQNRGKPGNLLALVAGLQNAQDQPSSLDTRATGSTTYTTSAVKAREGAGPGAPKGRSKLLELFWQGPGGVNIKNGKKVPQGFVSGHKDHVHVAAGPKTAVSLGKLAQDMGLNVGENPNFGSGRVGKHATGSYHYRRQAIDVSGDPNLMRKYAQAIAKLYGVK